MHRHGSRVAITHVSSGNNEPTASKAATSTNSIALELVDQKVEENKQLTEDEIVRELCLFF